MVLVVLAHDLDGGNLFFDVVLVVGLEVELVVDAFAPDHLHTQPQSPLYSRTHPFHPPSFSKIWRWLHARLRKLAT